LRLVGETTRATSLARRIAGDHPDCARAYVSATQIARKLGAMDSIEDLLEAGAKALPDDGRVLVQLANLRMRQERRTEAMELLDRAAAGKELDASYVVDISHIYTLIEPPDPVVEAWLEKAKDPDNHVANFIAGVVLHYRHRYTESDAHLARAEPSLGNETRLLIYRAMNRHRLGDSKTAATLIDKAVHGARPDPDVAYCRGVIHIDLDVERAITDLQQYIDATRDSREVYEPKQRRVALMLEDLKDCRGAKTPSECIENKATLRRIKPFAAGALAIVALLAGLLVWRRRRASTVALLVAFSALFVPGAAHAEAPRHLAAQWTWLGEGEQLQILIAGLLWLTAAAFFLGFRGVSARPGASSTPTKAASPLD
ncbi:MAG: hypothetical protein QF464_13235, partial [Myxococcota bacterium]|nr:hypothetical protein [Myxococcota bacterium]